MKRQSPTIIDRRLTTSDQIDKQPHCPRNSSRQLPEEIISAVDISPLAKLCDQQPAFLLRLTRIVRLQQGRKLWRPRRHEVEPALLHPAVEISLRDLIRIMKDVICRLQNLHRRLFHRHTSPAKRCGIWRIFARIEMASGWPEGEGVVLH